MDREPTRPQLVVAAVVVVTMAVQAGAAEAPDALVKQHLEAKGTPYEIDGDNDYKILVEWSESGRTQLVFVLSSTNEVAGTRVREIQSVGYRAPGELIPVEIANRLLADSNDKILGGWVRQGDRHAAFVVKIAADASADELDVAIDVAAAAADGLERELTGDTDEF